MTQVLIQPDADECPKCGMAMDLYSDGPAYLLCCACEHRETLTGRLAALRALNVEAVEYPKKEDA